MESIVFLQWCNRFWFMLWTRCPFPVFKQEFINPISVLAWVLALFDEWEKSQSPESNELRNGTQHWSSVLGPIWPEWEIQALVSFVWAPQSLRESCPRWCCEPKTAANPVTHPYGLISERILVQQMLKLRPQSCPFKCVPPVLDLECNKK